MKALRLLAIIMLATFSYQAVNAAQVKKHHKRHHSIAKRHHIVKKHR